MHKTKIDVDRHVQELFSKVKSAHERHLKCYNIARLYYKVGAYGAAKRHALMYLSVHENSDNAHQLLGDCHEKLGETDRAIAEYKRSLEIEPNQPGLILKMCDLMGQLSLSNLDIGRARYWCEKGDEHFPNNPIISRLKQKIIITEDTDPMALENFYIAECRSRPNDVNVLIQLLNLYLDSGRTTEAYNKAIEYEERSAFRHNLEWYRCLSRICMTCREEAQYRLSEPNLLKNSIEIYDRFLLLLHPATNVPSDESISNLYLLDQVLNDANENLIMNDQFDKEFMGHYSAQLSFHIALILLKRASQENLTWTEAVRCASPALLFALATPPDEGTPFSQDPKHRKKICNMIDDANYRIVQATLTLLNWAKGGKHEDFIGKILHYYSKNYREHIFSRVFLKQTQRKDAATSHWQNSSSFSKLPTEIPELSRILTKPILLSYESHNRDSLHNMIWLGLQIILLSASPKLKPILPPQFHFQTLTKFPFTHPSLSTSNIETLSKLDVDTFLFIAVLSNYFLVEDQIASSPLVKDRPTTLPADISSPLLNDDQAKFWTAICKLQSNSLNDNYNDLRSILVQGIEVVRLIGNHGLDVQMIVSVARLFEYHSKCVAKENVAHFENRALLYWSKAVKTIESMEKRTLVTPSKSRNRFFNHQPANYSTSLNPNEMLSLLEEGRLFIACDLMKKEEYERAINAFKPLRSPYASFNQALIFKKLAFNEVNFSSNDEMTSAMRSKHIILLTKARDALFLTKDKIQSDYDHRLHAALKLELQSIEAQLSRFDSEQVNANTDNLENDFSLSSISSPAGDTSPIHYPSRHDLSNFAGAPVTPTTFDAVRQYGVEKSILHDSTLANVERAEMKQLTKIHSKTLSLVEDLCKRIEKIEMDVNSIKKTAKKNDRNVEEILAKIYSKPSNTTVNEDVYFPQEELSDYVDDVNYGYPNYRGSAAYPMHSVSQHQNMYQPKLPSTNFPPQPIPPIMPAPYFPAGLPANSSLFPNPPGPAIPPFFPQAAALPFSEGQRLPDFLNASKLNPSNVSLPNLPLDQPILPEQPLPLSSKDGLPNNVVITKSDTLPTGSPPVQPTLSVTIPPQHLNSGRPKQILPSHSFHIALPTAESTPMKLPLGVDAVKPNVILPPNLESEVKASGGSKINVGGLTFSTQPVIKPAEIEDKNVQKAPVTPTPPPNPFAHLTLKSTATTAESLNQMFSSANIFGKQAATAAPSIFSNSASGVQPLVNTPESQPFAFSMPSKSESNTSLKSILKDTPSSQSPDLQKHVAFKTADADSSIFGKGSLDFAALASKGSDSSFKASNSFKGFEGQGSKLFDSSNSSISENKVASANASSDNAEDFVPTAEFKPVIALPDLVEVKTGEENLTVLYKERCKLLRFDAGLKEWKERGIGDMKLLHDPATNHVRMLMRREQVLKVCCNQRLTEATTLKPLTSSDKAWSWCGHDFSENEGKAETFAIRFKNSDIAKEFYNAVENAKKFIAENPSNSPQKSATETKTVGSDRGATNTKDVPLSEMFKPKAGSWECKDCYTRNDGDKLTCLACNGRNPNAPESAIPVVTSPFKLGLPSPLINVTSASSEFSFGIPQSSTTTSVTSTSTEFAFGIPQSTNALTTTTTIGNKNAAPVTSGFTFGLGKAVDNAASAASDFSFGIGKDNAAKPFSFTPATTENSSLALSFGVNGTANDTSEKTEIDHSRTNGGGFAFGSNLNDSSLSFGKEAEKKSGFQFGSGSEKGFSFSLKQQVKSPRSPGTRHSESEPETDEVSEADESADNIYFQPVVPLPDKIIPKTGEEDEVTLYQHLAKLYRFRDNEWKERGTGDIKLLKHTKTNKLRFVMRRKPVEVLCLNHYLTPDIEIKAKDKKSWTWTAPDFSDYNEFDRKAGVGLKPEVFSIRFKNEQIAQEFKSAVDAALSGAPLDVSGDGDKCVQDDDCQIVWPPQPTEADRKLARDLKLPLNFFDYRLTPPCSGCVGCEKDEGEEVYSSYQPETQETGKPSEKKPIEPSNPLASSQTSSLFSSSLNVTPVDQSQDKSYSSSVNSNNSNPGRFFNESSFTEHGATTPVSTSIFGGTGSAGMKPTSLFGGDSQTSPSSAKSVSIFGGSGQNTPLFGSLSQTQEPSFGSLNSQNSLFGSAADSNPVFGSSSLFGPAADKLTPGMFGASGSLFGSQTSSITTSEADTTTAEQTSTDPAFTLKTSGISFASLAANSPTFASDKASKPFSFAGSGSTVFGSLSSSLSNESHNKSSEDATNENDNDGNDEHYEDNDHDPHYEPIVPLPDKIVVRTGEEDEEKLFVQRAKLYRYETTSKQWKERGTGEMKILKDPVNLTYRLLLRRDMIHKVVCNIRITSSLELKPMSLSPNAFMFFAHNLADDYSEPQLEQLAVKFKNDTILNQFKDIVNECIAEIEANKHNNSSVLDSSHDDSTALNNTENEGGDEDHDEEAEDEEAEGEEVEDEEGGEEYDDDEDEILFINRATVFRRESKKSSWSEEGKGDICIYHNFPFYIVSLALENPSQSTDSDIVNTGIMIEPDATIDRKGQTLVWSGSNTPSEDGKKSEFMTKFLSKEAAAEFHTAFLEAKETGRQAMEKVSLN